jgi:D-alanyl-D-alanine carboxypeptidase
MTGISSPLRALFTLIISVSALAGCSSGSGIPSAEYQALLDKAVPEYQVMGMVAGVETSEGVWKGASGRANFATGAPMNPDLQIHVASVTKPLTATVAMKLVDDGVLKLDDTVEKWLPGVMVKNASLITVSQLLSHTSGVFDHESLADFWATVLADTRHEWTSDEILQISYAQDPYFAPGEGAKYSNTGYYILGMIVEAATKGAFESTAQSLVFGPAGMTRTALTRQGTKTLPYSREYSVLQSGQSPRDVTEWNLS